VPIEKRSLCAPFDGRIQRVLVELGDSVKAGDALMELDTYDLELELHKWQLDAAAYDKEADKARADGPSKTAELLIAEQKRDAALLQARLAQSKIDQATIRAGIDGKVLVGNWKEKIGSGVTKGDVLFEVVQPQDLRAELMVADRDVQLLHEGQRISVATTGLPQDRYEGRITRITGLGEPSEGRNYYRVYADLLAIDPKTHAPGLTGEARIDVERRTLAWIWTHRVIDWLRLKTWM
jgi:multidrug resistance efflux pump